jgi:glycosyltransferase involved in cell wall biosynthesis
VPPLRVTFVAPFGLRRRGTTAARVIPLASALARRGHRVQVVIPEWDCPQAAGRGYLVGDAEVRHLAVSPAVETEYSARLLLQTYRAALDGRPDVIHCFKPIGYSGAVALLLRHATSRGRWRGLLAVDADDLEGRDGWAARAGRPGWQVMVLDWQERRAVQSARLVTVASHYLAARARDWRGHGRGIAYLPNAVRNAPCSPGVAAVARRDAGTQLLLYTRFNEFSPERGARLIAAVLNRLPAAQLTVVGDGDAEARETFRRGLRESGVSSRVKFSGLLNGNDLWATLASADVALWPFDDTPINRARCPAKLLELLAVGTAVVAEDAGEVGRLAGRGARLVCAGVEEQFIAAAVELASGATERSRLRALAQDVASNQNWQRRAEKLESSYRAALRSSCT